LAPMSCMRLTLCARNEGEISWIYSRPSGPRRLAITCESRPVPAPTLQHHRIRLQVELVDHRVAHLHFIFPIGAECQREILVVDAGAFRGQLQRFSTDFRQLEQTVRVYFATRPLRDGKGLYVSRPGYVDLCRHDLGKIKAVSPKPLLELGQTGAFDEFGIMPSSVVRVGDDVFMYYTG
jgi:hypothetical protein